MTDMQNTVPMNTTLVEAVQAGASSLEVTSADGFHVGDELNISGGGHQEVIRIKELDLDVVPSTTVLIHSLTYPYPRGSIVTIACLPTPTPTAAPTTGGGSPGSASLLNDPHVTNLNGERFDIRMPSSDCTLLRLPYSEHLAARPGAKGDGPSKEEDPAMLELSASVDTDGVRACGLYVKGVTLSGSLLGNRVVRVRPHTRNACGSNQAAGWRRGTRR